MQNVSGMIKNKSHHFKTIITGIKHHVLSTIILIPIDNYKSPEMLLSRGSDFCVGDPISPLISSPRFFNKAVT